MNPCINCPLDSQGCHECGFADAKCAAWIEWKTSLLIFKAEARQRSSALTKKRRGEEMWLTEMHFYWWEENGRICVQNMIAGMTGQKHRHSKEGFKGWIKENQIEKRLLHKIK